ncbi:MAG: cytochrome c [Nitrospirae bacterium]|nr:cytochrome c [Nitrospirota bacterium]
MQIFFFKSLLSVVVLVSVFVAMFTMFEMFGRTERRFDAERLRKIHRANGFMYLLLFFFISYLCLDFIVRTKAELSFRGAFHAVFSLAVLVLVFLKIAFNRFYRKYYSQVQILGLVVALLSFGVIGTSAGYYLLITKLGSDRSVGKAVEVRGEPMKAMSVLLVKTDSESIAKGKELYETKCYFCHDAYSIKAGVGPGHKGILKNPRLPVSGRPATPANVVQQLRTPFKDMPSYAYLSDEEMQNIIAFLLTL